MGIRTGRPVVIPLERRLQIWAAVSPEQGDFRRELLVAADEVIALKKKIRETQKALREARRGQ